MEAVLPTSHRLIIDRKAGYPVHYLASKYKSDTAATAGGAEARDDVDLLPSSNPKHVLLKCRLLAHSTVVSSSREDSCGEHFEEISAAATTAGSSSSHTSSSISSVKAEKRGEGQFEACHASDRCCLHRNFVTKVITNYLANSISPFVYSSIYSLVIASKSFSAMSSISFLIRLFVVTALLSTTTASTKLLIVGQSRNNNYKFAFAEQYTSDIDPKYKESGASFYVFTQASCAGYGIIEDVYTNCQHIPQGLSGNFSTIIVSQRGTDEMSLSEIETFYNFLDKLTPTLVIEIGDEAVQTRALLMKKSQCWGETSAQLISPNKAFLCNDLQPAMVSAFISRESIQLIPQNNQLIGSKEEVRPIWPCIFASAASSKSSKKSKQASPPPKVVKKVEDDNNEDDDNDDDDDDDDEVVGRKSSYRHHKAPQKEEDKKLECKYRKSCYETGKMPEIDQEMHFWPSFLSENSSTNDDDDKDSDDEDGDGDDVDADDDARILALKVKCKYRLDCYEEKNIPLSEKEMEHNEKKKHITSNEATPVPGKKTLKDIAQKTVKKVKEAEQKAASRPLPKSIIAEKKFEAMENEMNKKLDCKYRKSCYINGNIPEIAGLWGSVASDEGAIKKEKIIDFADMEELDQKVHCKYRKSCYATGVQPDIEPEIQINHISDLKNLPDIVETRKMTIQEKCKYRKSCYETGVLPALHPPVEEIVEAKHISSVIPANVQQLKHLCKYRKSCYEEVAESSMTVDVVKNIRKRHLIEKEERRRRHRRDKLRRRTRGAIEFEEEQPIRSKSSEKQKERRIKKDKEQKNHQATHQENIQEVEEQVIQKVETVPTQRSKKDRKKSPPVDISTAQEVVDKVMEDEQLSDETVKATVKKSKKNKKSKIQPQEVADFDAESVLEEKIVEDVVKKSVKKSQQLAKDLGASKEIQEDDSSSAEKNDNDEDDDDGKKKKKSNGANVMDQSELHAEGKSKDHPKEKKSKRDKHVKEETIRKEIVSPNMQEPPKDAKVPKSKKEGKSSKAADHKKKLSKKMDDQDDNIDKFAELQKQRDFCKYRKSCYESGEKPQIDQTISTMYTSFNDHVEKVYEKDQNRPRSESDQKLDCKYRKSCYDTGELPDLNIRQDVVVPKLDEIHDKKLDCKYRKSCYDDAGIVDEAEKVQSQEEVRKNIQKVASEPNVKKPVVEKKNEKNEKTEDERKKQKDDDDDDDEDEEDKRHHRHEKEEKIKEVYAKTEETNSSELDVDQKLQCKYRKSCYGTVKPRSKNQDHSGSIARQAGDSVIRTKCNEYYLSCREKMGLPPKEKAPIGPSGRKLCRKKKE